MNVLIFNGCSDYKPDTTGRRLAAYLQGQFEALDFEVTPYHISESPIPFFDLHETTPPDTVSEMCDRFLNSDLQVWMTPLYHGGMTGVMKNCFDWLELTARNEKPYLTDKVVGLVAWADGGQAMQGINAMDAVAKALRAWVVPYTVPLVKNHLYTDGNRQTMAGEHTRKLDRLVGIMSNARRLLLPMVLCLLFFFSRAQEPAHRQPAAQGPSSVQVNGIVTTPLTLTTADLLAMPRTTVTAKDKDGTSHQYTGVPVAEILNKAGVTTGKQLRGKNMAKYLLVTCADGYQVLFSLAELDSAFTDRVVILADHEGSEPLPANRGPFRLIVPGEKRPARDCYQVSKLTIGEAKE